MDIVKLRFYAFDSYRRAVFEIDADEKERLTTEGDQFTAMADALVRSDNDNQLPCAFDNEKTPPLSRRGLSAWKRD